MQGVSLSEEQRLKLESRLNPGIHGMPPNLNWNQNVQQVFPNNNNHNTPYYKYNQVLEEKLVEWIDKQSDYLENSVIQTLVTDKIIRTTKTGKCGKCNRLFYSSGQSSKILRHPCVVLCPCSNNKEEFEANCCVRCQLIQWYLLGSLSSSSTSAAIIKQPIYMLPTGPHPGFAMCPKCKQIPLTISNFWKIK
jgi:hypothetical protein